MQEIERYGVKIDICPTSGGIWLDKGELEKLIMMIRQEALEEHAGQSAYGEPDYDDEPAYAPRQDTRPKRRKRESIFENIMDIFD
jgi:Zn-finger nucleic acid-binding protein